MFSLDQPFNELRYFGEASDTLQVFYKGIKCPAGIQVPSTCGPSP